MAEKLRDVLGTRAKIGILIPATNTTVEPEMAAMQPPGVTNHISRMSRSNRPTNDMDLYRKAMGRSVEMTGAIDLLSACEPDVIALGHSIDSFVGGLSGAHAMKARMEAMAGGIPVILPSLAILRALEVMGKPRKLAFLTPWMPPGDEACQAFFEGAGYDVLAIKGLKHPTALHIATADAALLNRSVDEINVPGVECIVKVGTNSAMSRLVKEMEARIGKPVLTVNVVTYWAALRFLGIHDKLPGYGRLAEAH